MQIVADLVRRRHGGDSSPTNGKFNRAVLILRCPASCFTFRLVHLRIHSRDQDEHYLKVKLFIETINRAALPNIQGSLRSYELSPTEKEHASNGMLDIITGFVIMDDKLRMVVLEGLSAGGMAAISSYLPRNRPNSKSYTLLHNASIRFYSRMYSAFGCDLKYIRVRNGMRNLSQYPELYNHRVVSIECYDGVEKLTSLFSVTDLSNAKNFDLFPSVESIESIELLFGEAVSLEDIEGNKSQRDNVVNIGSDDGSHRAYAAKEDTISAPRYRRQSDCRNLSFEKYLAEKGKNQFDHLVYNRTLREAAIQQGWEKLAERIRIAELSRSLESKASNQRSSYLVKAKKKRPDFVYPKPRTLAERVSHPKKPSKSRIEELHRPYEEYPEYTSAELHRNLIEIRAKEANFRLRLKAIDLFGLPEPPVFEHDFEPRLLRDRDRLPRGRMTKGHSLDPEFVKSVHLMDSERLAQLEEANRAEAQLWRSKVVVKDLDFKI